MKRPMAVVGMTILAAQIFAVIVGARVSAVLAVLAVCFIAASFKLVEKEHRKIVLPVLVSCFAALSFHAAYTFGVVNESQVLEGHTVFVRGVITEAPYESNERYYYIIKTEFVDQMGAPQNIRIRVSSRTPLEAEISDIFGSEVVFNQSSADEVMSVKYSRLSRGITATAYIKYGMIPQISEGRRGIVYLVDQLRDKLFYKIDVLLDGELSALLRGVLLGDKSRLQTGVVSDFRVCGLSHLLAVSGLHMSIIVYALTVMLRQMGISHRPLAGIVFIILWGYIALTGFSYSVLRAGIMTSLMLLARVVKREADELNSLGFALTVICMSNPYAAVDAGLLLSVLSTLGLILLHKPVARKTVNIIDKLSGGKLEWTGKLVSAMLTSIIASVSTLPVIALYFGEYSLISPFANLICVQLANIFMVSGAIAVILSFVPFIGGFFSGIILIITRITGKLLLFVAEMLANIPFASINVNYNFMPVFIIGAIALCVAWYVLFGKSKERFASFVLVAEILAATLIFGIISEEVVHANDHIVKIYDVGEGVAIVAESEGCCAVVGTGGERYDVWNMTLDMQDNNISRVDAVFYPSSDDEYASYAYDFIRDISPRRVYVPDEENISDEIIFAVKDYDAAKVINVSNSVFESERDNLKITTYDEGNQKIWVHISAGKINLLVCPEGGDALAIPSEMRYPDCAVVMSENIINVTALETGAIVVSADRDECASAVAMLRYRGVDKVFSTADGDIIITEHKAGIMVGGD